jgi:hypothetical protein
LPWEEQSAVINYFKEKVFKKWQFERMTMTSLEGNAGDTGLEVVVWLKRNTNVETRKVGWFTNLSEFPIPYIVHAMHSPDPSSAKLLPSGKPHAQYTIFLPDNAFVRHNLIGDFKETVFENGNDGLVLNSDSIHDYFKVIRIKHYASFLYNPIFRFLTKISGWTLVLWALTFVCGIIGYLLGVALDVFKDNRLKPMATNLLTKAGLLAKTNPIRPNCRKSRKARNAI